MVPGMLAPLVGLVLALHAPPSPAGAPPTVATPLMAADAQWELVAATVRVAAGAGKPPFGSAVCIGSRGGAVYLLTAGHVVPRGEARSYEFFGRASYPKPCDIVFEGDVAVRLPECDLAVVKVPLARDDVPTVSLARLDQRPRRFPAPALALGCPDGESPVVRVESLTARTLVRRAEGNGFFWESKTAPHGGTSGGPLVDPQGRLLGICAAAQGGQGYFTHLDEILAGLKRHGYGWLIDGTRKP